MTREELWQLQSIQHELELINEFLKGNAKS